MDGKNLVFTAAVLLLIAISFTQVSGAAVARFKRASGTAVVSAGVVVPALANNTGGGGNNSALANQTLQSILNLFNATAFLPVAIQQQAIILFGNGTNLTLQAIQNFQNYLQNISSNLNFLNTLQQQAVRNISAAIQNITQNGVKAFQQVSQNLTSAFQNFTQIFNVFQIVQSGIKNITAQNPGGQILAAFANITQQMNSGNLTTIFASIAENITSTGQEAFQQIIALLTSNGGAVAQGLTGSLNTVANFLTNSANTFGQVIQNVVVKPVLGFFQSFFSIFG